MNFRSLSTILKQNKKPRPRDLKFSTCYTEHLLFKMSYDQKTHVLPPTYLLFLWFL